MRISLITWFASSIILIGGALLAALAQDAKERRPHNQFISTHSIDTRELTLKATGPLSLQFYDVI